MTLVDKFKYKETLSIDSLTKVVRILGEIDGKPAIVTLERLMFKLNDQPEEDEGGSNFYDTLGLKEIRRLEANDVYSWFVATVNQSLANPSVKVNLIYPATETHIKKYRAQTKKIVTETPEDYQKVVVPYIGTMKGDRLQWVYNILHHGAEKEKVVYRNDDETNGFVLLPDMKWDGVTLDTLYLVAIVLRHDISSVRDLKPSHIPFLQSLKQEILDVVCTKYGLDRDQLKLYFHYQPSYYHLHLHVANSSHEQLDFGKSLFLDNIIDQLKFMPNGLVDATYTYAIGENHQLYKDFKKMKKVTH